MPDLILTILRLIFLALIYIFVWQVGKSVAGHLGFERRVKEKPGRHLVIVRSESQPGVDIEVKGAVLMGRSKDADVVLDDPYASDFHARVVANESRVVLHDLGSTNGTYVNGKRVTTPVPLSRGDAVQVGKTIMEVK